MRDALDIFKIGIGPSSSHTLGPMLAGRMFVETLDHDGLLERATGVTAHLYGSLSLTGKGHLTDQAIVLGLAGFRPDTVTIEEIPGFMEEVRRGKKLDLLERRRQIDFDPDRDIVFHGTSLPLHENGMRLVAVDANGEIAAETYYSPGGGEVKTETDFDRPTIVDKRPPHEFASAEQMLDLCRDNGLSIAGLAWENAAATRGGEAIRAHCHRIWEVMREALKRGSQAWGLLPGPMRVARRASALRQRLTSQAGLSRDPLLIIDWVNMFALAASEENAAGGRVVTAPTNGSCGVVPAILAYYDKFVAKLDDEMLERFFLTAGTIGQLFRRNASISGAEVGCQGEIGVAASMAAAGLTELMGADPVQVCMAAEIAMEHNLGLTCDPVGGQVQIPCIERNAVNAVMAINAARMAMDRVSRSRVSLDNVMQVMMATGKDMHVKYRETAQGGLAAIPKLD